MSYKIIYTEESEQDLIIEGYKNTSPSSASL
jgi:hypothetical protein